jgi:hypothetical protein
LNIDSLLEATKEKQLESNCRVPMVAFLLRNGKPIAYGVNKKGYRGSSGNGLFEESPISKAEGKKHNDVYCTIP